MIPKVEEEKMEVKENLTFQPIFPIINGKIGVLTDVIANSPKLMKIQNEVKLILLGDTSKNDEEAIGFPSLNIQIKPPTMKVNLNEKL